MQHQILNKREIDNQFVSGVGALLSDPITGDEPFTQFGNISLSPSRMN